MKANELRIGNLLSFNNMITKEEIVKVNAWFLRQLVHDPKVENPQLTGYHQPIPLTEEWLIRFGFKKINHIHNGIYYLHKLTKISIYPNGMIELRGAPGFNKIHYVHQLQNLYFALTGEELTLKQ